MQRPRGRGQWSMVDSLRPLAAGKTLRKLPCTVSFCVAYSAGSARQLVERRPVRVSPLARAAHATRPLTLAGHVMLPVLRRPSTHLRPGNGGAAGGVAVVCASTPRLAADSVGGTLLAAGTPRVVDLYMKIIKGWADGRTRHISCAGRHRAGLYSSRM